MCGIAGIFGPRARTDAASETRLGAELATLCSGLGHRGPDARGTRLLANGGLVHSRLAILDPSQAGAQPMSTPDGRWTLVYNGEVYNFGALRDELEARGERFVGRSDTEVVLRLLALDGEHALSRLDGMFALALWDAETRELLLARDRMGQKPLYLARRRDGSHAFASELLPLLRTPGVDGSLCPDGLSLLLTLGFVPAPFTLRRGICQLLPGTLVRWRPGRAPTEQRFAEPPGPREPLHQGSHDRLVDELEERMSRAVSEHLVSDVPVGVLLSGGVDSSAVAALAARHVSRLETFALVHRDPHYDERGPARAVAEAIGSRHHEIEFSEAPLSEDELDTLVDHHGDPFSDSSSLAVLRLSTEMRRHVTVALSGDGADELFAGYPRFGELRTLSRVAALPAPLLALAEKTCGLLPGATGRRAARGFRVARMPAARRTVGTIALFWPEASGGLLQTEWRAPDAPGLLDRVLDERGASLGDDPIESAHWLEQRLVLADNMLVKVDRMSMAVALEVRPPILANALVDWSWRLPFDAKHRGRIGKRVLRDLTRRLVPPWVVDRPKQGFAVPLDVQGGKVLEDATRFALESHESPLRRIFRPDALAALAAEAGRTGEGRDPEDSPGRRMERRWLLCLLARSLARHGGV